MSGVTDNLGLILPASGETYDVEILNANNGAIDAAAVIIDYANSTYNTGGWNLTLCKFTRLRIGTKGIVIAELTVSLPGVAMPANTAAPLELANVLPAGYCPILGSSLPLQPATTANSGTGSALQIGLKNDRTMMIRSGGAAFTLTAGSTLTYFTTYRWDGKL